MYDDYDEFDDSTENIEENKDSYDSLADANDFSDFDLTDDIRSSNLYFQLVTLDLNFLFLELSYIP